MRLVKNLSIIVMTIVLICCQSPNSKETTSATASGEAVEAAVNKLYEAIIEADSSKLDAITCAELVYGHSSGRVQDKTEFISELLNPDALDFTSFSISDQSVTVVNGVAIVRHIWSAETINKGLPGSLRIGIMLVMDYCDGEWKLLARQAYGLPVPEK